MVEWRQQGTNGHNSSALPPLPGAAHYLPQGAPAPCVPAGAIHARTLSLPSSGTPSPSASCNGDSETSSACELRCLSACQSGAGRRASLLADAARAGRRSASPPSDEAAAPPLPARDAPLRRQEPQQATALQAAAPAPPPASPSLPQRLDIDCVDNAGASHPHTLARDDPWWVMPYSFGSHLDQNQRAHMEDRLLTADLSGDARLAGTGARRAGFFAVYDGHGGAEAAEHLQQHLLGYLLAHPGLGSDPAAALRGAVERAEQEVLAALSATACNAGSTLLAALLLDGSLHVAHVGDCRAVLARGAEPRQLTSDHKPCCAIERARIAAADPAAEVTPDGYIYGELAVSRAIGSQHIKCDPSKRALTPSPDVVSIPLSRDDDFVLLASDGLWDTVDNAEAVTTARRVLARDADAGAAARALVDRALKRNSTDNISVVVLRLHERRICLPKTNSMLFRRLSGAASAGAAGGAGCGAGDSPRSATPSSYGTGTLSRCDTPQSVL